MTGLVSSGVADVGVAPFIVTNDRHEGVAFTDQLAFTT
jgi:hypothetical protein